MNAARALTPEELAERWNLRVKRGPRAGKLNVEYCREKARTGQWPCIRLPGSKFIRFDLEWVEAVESGALAVEETKPRSLKIRTIQETEAHSHRKERRWE